MVIAVPCQAEKSHIIAVMGVAFYDVDRIPGPINGFDPLENFNSITASSAADNEYSGEERQTPSFHFGGHSLQCPK